MTHERHSAADLDTVNCSISNHERGDALVNELAWEDVSLLASAYFGDVPEDQPELTSSVTGRVSSTSTRSEIEHSKETAGVRSDHFAYSDSDLRWDATPSAPDASRADISESLAVDGYGQASRSGSVLLPFGGTDQSFRSADAAQIEAQPGAPQSTAGLKANIQRMAQKKFRVKQKVTVQCYAIRT